MATKADELKHVAAMKKAGVPKKFVREEQAEANAMKKGGWIKGAIKSPGALHKQLGVPQGEKIPAGKLEKAAQSGGKLGQRARLAETLRGFRK